MSDQPIITQPPSTNDSYVDSYNPPGSHPEPPADQAFSFKEPAIDPPQPAASNQSQSRNQAISSESLEDQNIFDLLGVDDGEEAEREQFLDELQQVIWEDFLENDLNLLITDDEMGEVRDIQNRQLSDLEKQEAIVTYLEKLIPDLEDIMLEKALELKEKMVKERVAGMKAFLAGQQDKLDILKEAESMFSKEKWLSGAKLLNSVSI